MMHRKGIYHRDLKPENILILNKTDLLVCIADLGLACRSTDTHDLTFKCGTPGYVAPELLKGFPFGPKADVFSLGCLAFNMATGKMLFHGRDTHETLFKNKYLDTTAIIEGTCQRLSRECRDLLKKMTAHNPDHRLTTEECLRHAWFTQDAE